MRIAVVGSGPGGIACTKALIRRGFAVTLFDVGERLDDLRQSMVQKLRVLPPAQWDRRIVDSLTENPTIKTRPIPKKLVFGSDYLYATDRIEAPFTDSDAEARPTFAQGGYSIAWGAAVLPVHDDDIDDWPIRRIELTPAYERVLAGIPLSGQIDRLAEEFPPYKSDLRPLKLNAGAIALLDDILQARSGRDKIIAGQARLAVRADNNDDTRGCVYCGMCLSGCPIGAIYNCADDLTALQRTAKLDYRSDHVVKRVSEEAGWAELEWIVRGGGYGREKFDRIFLAAGAIQTTRIMLESIKLFETPVQMKESLKFAIPFLRASSSHLQWPNANTLPDVFFELRAPDISRHWAHFQISSVNDLLLRRFGMITAGDINARGRALAPLLRRVMIAWAGLHSDDSSSISLTLGSKTVNGHYPVQLKNLPNPQAEPTVRKIVMRLTKLGLKFRSLFLPMMTAVNPPGVNGHVGGTFPMRSVPSRPLETDIWGRPSGWHRIHLVDGAIFPSIPGTTIALTIMANADRIATDFPLEQDA
jgi:choline dehydrogenase-like flavoprotein